MNDTMRVSIIMLNYNSGKEIFESIQSVLVQTYSNLELVISDDASSFFPSSEIKQLLNDCNNPDFSYKLIENQHNLGTVKNINNAVLNCKGDLLINLSAGDIFYDKDVVKNIVEEFQNTKCRFLITRRALYKNDISNIIGYMPSAYEIKKIQNFKNAKEEYIALCTSDFHNLASGCVFACKRDFLREYNNYDEKYRLWEDGPFFSKILKNGIKINYNFDIISIYYRYGGVSTGELSPMMRSDIDIFLSQALKENCFSGFNRRKLEYAYQKKVKIYNNHLAILFYRIKYLDVMLYRLMQKIDEKVFYLLNKDRK